MNREKLHRWLTILNSAGTSELSEPLLLEPVSRGWLWAVNAVLAALVVGVVALLVIALR